MRVSFTLSPRSDLSLRKGQFTRERRNWNFAAALVDGYIHERASAVLLRGGRWTGGRVPFGYDVVERKIVVNDREALVVREVFALYEQHRSLLSVMRELAMA